MALLDNEKLKELTIYSHISANMANILSMEKYEIGIKTNFDTACWYYSYKDEANKISIGDGIFDGGKEGYNNYQKIVDSFFIHEAAHSIYTSKNLVQLKKKLDEEKLSFKLFNLFEDARIEMLIRQNFGYNFNWTDFMDIPEDSINEKASTTLFKIIQSEDTEYFNVPYYEKVKNYYDKIVKTKNEDELIDIMKKWITDFPNDVEPENNKNMSNGKGNGKSGENQQEQEKGNSQNSENEEKSDLELASEIQGDKDFENEFESNVEVVVGDAKKQQEELEEEIDKKDKKSVKYLNEVKAESVSIESSNTETIFVNTPYQESKLFKDKLEDAENKLKRILKSIDLEEINSTSHAQKFNVKGVIQALNGSPNAKPYKKSVEEDYEFNKKKVFILLDGSGSMGGLPEKNMITFAVAVNRLANNHLFEGWLGGSKIVRGKSLTQALQLPLSDGQITSFNADSESEGLGYAIKTHMEKIKESDFVFVLTDGQIHDMDLEFIKNKMPEVYNKTFGVYMGHKKHANEKAMKKWFANTIFGDKFENTVEEIVKILDPKAKNTTILNELKAINSENKYKEEYYEQNLNPNRL